MVAPAARRLWLVAAGRVSRRVGGFDGEHVDDAGKCFDDLLLLLASLSEVCQPKLGGLELVAELFLTLGCSVGLSG